LYLKMPCTCKIGRSGKAEEVDRLLDAEKSLDAIAAKTGLHRSAIYRHSRRCRDERANAPGAATAADRQLLKHWNDLHKKSVKAGNWDAAARALGAISEIQARIAAESRPPEPRVPRPDEPLNFVVRYETSSVAAFTPEQLDFYLCGLLRERGQREGTPDRTRAAIARCVSELEGTPLPPALEAQCRELLDLCLKGNKRDELS
jgi:hypothetical protein